MTTKRDALDRLSAALVLAEKRIYELNPGVQDWVKLPCGWHLWWAKERGKWGLYVDGDELNRTRVHESKVAVRLEAAHALPGLLLSLHTTLQAEVDDIESAAAAAETFAGCVSVEGFEAGGNDYGT